jgi:hypothetical protein
MKRMKGEDINIVITEEMTSGENDENDRAVHIREENGTTIRNDGPTDDGILNGIVDLIEIEAEIQLMTGNGRGEVRGTVTENGEITTSETEVPGIEKKVGQGVNEADQGDVKHALIISIVRYPRHRFHNYIPDSIIEYDYLLLCYYYPHTVPIMIINPNTK